MDNSEQHVDAAGYMGQYQVMLYPEVHMRLNAVLGIGDNLGTGNPDLNPAARIAPANSSADPSNRALPILLLETRPWGT